MENKSSTASPERNIDNMNFFLNFKNFLLNGWDYRRIPFLLNSILFLVSFLVLFIPTSTFLKAFPFEKEIILKIYYLVSIYLFLIIIYTLYKICPIKRELFYAILLIFSIFASIYVALCLIPLYKILNNWVLPEDQLPVSEFGSFFASITGLLTLLGIYTYDRIKKNTKEPIIQTKPEEAIKKAEEKEQETRKKYNEEKERKLFFQLLDLHRKNLGQFYYIEDNPRKEKSYGMEAFKRYAEEINNTLEKDVSSLVKNGEVDEKYISVVIPAYNQFDEKYGYILEPYFKNMQCILNIIDQFQEPAVYKRSYIQLFKAQLSRYEIILGILYVTFSKSDESLQELFRK